MFAEQRREARGAHGDGLDGVGQKVALAEFDEMTVETRGREFGRRKTVMSEEDEGGCHDPSQPRTVTRGAWARESVEE